jgi:hypothetical protein
MGAAASLPVDERAQDADISRDEEQKENCTCGHKDKDRLLDVLHSQLALPMDASDTKTLYDARKQLSELRFALSCTSRPPAIACNENQDEVQSSNVVIPAIATVAQEAYEETGDFNKSLQVLGISASE